MTKQLLDYTRRDPTHVQTFDLGALICDLSRPIARLIGRHIQLVVDVPGDLWVVADRGSEPGRGSTFTVVLPESAKPGELKPVRLRAHS